MRSEQMPGPMATCDEVKRQLWDFLDEELTPELMAAIAAHVSSCRRCFPQVEFERTFLQAVRAVRQDHPPRAEQRERVLALLRANGLPGGTA